ncbi:phospholipase D-like domain-containing protein [Microbulbifer yueqingensis]|uniref:Putative cardiolipin synthase n=1 Tax=Microbulbifer yueqingensis TaxID=658219 RepID=A0A1G8XV98_9GAMM|nr:phospholipase D family protein [Microbulbifer yueqingensis]SDJ94433.1 putative cardiolipin synthase [Microbulbifer yueqingensis]
MADYPLRVLRLVLLFSLTACTCPHGPGRFPSPPEREASRVLQPGTDAPLVTATRRLSADHPGETGVYPVTSAHNALAVRLATIRAARYSIDIQYFIFRRDETGLLLTHELIDAADRGVRVRFLLDDFTTRSARTALAALDHHPNVEVRLFNPFPHKGPRPVEFFSDFCRLHRRMHNKSFTVDNRVSFIGGRNLSNKYFGIDGGQVFGDLELVTIGAAVDEISLQFDHYWNSHYSFPVRSVFAGAASPGHQAAFLRELQDNTHALLATDYGQQLLESPVIPKLRDEPQLWYWSPAEVLVDPPRKVSLTPQVSNGFASRKLLEWIRGARSELVIISPYLLPDAAYLDALLAAARRGVRVQILTNSLSSADVALVYGAYRKYRRPLLRAGIQLYELSGKLNYKLDNWRGTSRSLLHAKLLVVDRRALYVGSFNLDHRSVLHNTELGLLLQSGRLAQEFTDNFSRNVRDNAYELFLDQGQVRWRDGSGRIYDHSPETSLLQRWVARVSGWLPLEHLL